MSFAQRNKISSISVIIPAYNAAKTIRNTVEAVISPKGLPAKPEIIVVDDGSNDDTVKILKDYPDVITITQPNSGPATARNTGAFFSKGEIVVFTDSDTIPHPDWLYELTKPFEDNRIYATTGTYSIANPENELAQFIQREIALKHSNYKDFILFGGSYNLAIRKRLFTQIGGFNEEYKKASGEDTEICYKILKEGHKIKYVPTAIVSHYHPEKLGKYLKTQYTHGYWRAKLYYSFPQRAAGDSYTGLKEAFETIFSATFLVSLIFNIITKIIGSNKNKKIITLFFITSLICLILTEFKAAFSIKKSTADDCKSLLPSTSRIIAILILRALYRTSGFFVGLIDFFPDLKKRFNKK